MSLPITRSTFLFLLDAVGTASIVGKVVNFMVSRQSVVPTWSTLLDKWKQATPRYGRDEGISESDEDAKDEDDEEEAQHTQQGQSWFKHRLMKWKREI